MIPFGVDVPMKRLPWANWALILVTIVVSLAVPSVTGGSLSQPKLSHLVLQRQEFAPYQLVTSLFQHADFLHLFGNMFFLFVFGNAINAKLGHLAYLASYLGIGALESVIWLVMLPGEATLGASAAIAGISGMFLVLYPLNDVRVFWEVDFFFALLPRGWTGEMPGWSVVLIHIVFDIWGAIFYQHKEIGYLSHIVGAVSGITLAIVLLKVGWLRPDRGEQTLLQLLAGEGPTEEEPSRRQTSSEEGGKELRELFC